MNDPHLEALTYSLVSDPSCQYDAPPLSVTFPGFEGDLNGGILTLRPTAHFSTEDSARALIEPSLRAWSISAGLAHGRDDFRFEYSGATVIDRNPTPGTGSLSLSSHIRMSGDAHVMVIRRQYPPLPTDFVATPEVEVLWQRLAGYISGREPLLSMAYFCLTLLERPDRATAAKSYNIDIAVLKKLGELTSTRGNPTTARKASPIAPLSPHEEDWTKAALKALIFHLAGNRSKALMLSSLPPL